MNKTATAITDNWHLATLSPAFNPLVYAIYNQENAHHSLMSTCASGTECSNTHHIRGLNTATANKLSTISVFTTYTAEC